MLYNVPNQGKGEQYYNSMVLKFHISQIVFQRIVMDIMLCISQVVHWECLWTAKENLEVSEFKKPGKPL